MTRHEKRGVFGRSIGDTNSNSVIQNSNQISGENKMSAVLTTAEGSTRGKNPRKITYLKFDVEKPDTLPKTLAEFLESTKSVNEDKPYTQEEMVGFVIDGFNSAQYSAAADEIGEYIPDSWKKEDKAQFRLAVRNTSKLTGMSIEDTVNMLKPAVEKGLIAKAAAEEEAKKAAASTQPSA